MEPFDSVNIRTRALYRGELVMAAGSGGFARQASFAVPESRGRLVAAEVSGLAERSISREGKM